MAVFSQKVRGDSSPSKVDAKRTHPCLSAVGKPDSKLAGMSSEGLFVSENFIEKIVKNSSFFDLL